MTLPAISWLAYALFAYVGWTVYFRARYGRSALAERFPPRSLYEIMDFVLAAELIGYSVWIVFGPEPRPVGGAAGTWGGLSIVGLAAALRVWAVVTLGPNWRIGQDDADPHAEYVAAGPYRWMRHPINTALVLVAIGQALMTGLEWRAMSLLGVAVVYMVVQGRAEERHWEMRQSATRAIERGAASKPAPPDGVGG